MPAVCQWVHGVSLLVMLSLILRHVQKMHEQSTFVCTDCHTEAQSEVPENWEHSEYEEEALA